MGEYLNSDGDGWSDYKEEQAGTDPLNEDTNGNGIIDSKDPNPVLYGLRGEIAGKPKVSTTTEPPTETPVPTTSSTTSKGVCGPTTILLLTLISALGVNALEKRKIRI